jgi:hypothetical protein
MATHAENMFHRPILQPLRLSGIPSRRHRLPISQKTQMCQPILKSFTLNSTYIDYLKYQVREIANIKISSAKKATCQTRGTLEDMARLPRQPAMSCFSGRPACNQPFG